MIVLRAVRVEDTGAETELGEVRLTEVGVVYSHLATADGQAVVADVVERLRSDAPVLRPLAKAHARREMQVVGLQDRYGGYRASRDEEHDGVLR